MHISKMAAVFSSYISIKQQNSPFYYKL